MKSADRRPHVVTFTSSSTVKNFAELLGNMRPTALKKIQFASIGPVTSSTLRELQMPASIEAREFTMGGLIRAIVIARYAEHSL
jgi:uroporphyrinogen-III synthase